MFNGIISHTGRVRKIHKSKNNCIMEIYSKMSFTKKEIGDSISCSGACLTLEKINNVSLKNKQKITIPFLRQYFFN